MVVCLLITSLDQFACKYCNNQLSEDKLRASDNVALTNEMLTALNSPLHQLHIVL